jgi:CAAX prenyl protease-like protein
VITLRPTRPMGSLLIGILVFGVWIGPDLIWPAYRQNWLFQNTLAGAAQSTVAHRLRYQYTFLTFRLLGTVVLIPVIEEVFWRGWLMRYLICSEFQKVRLGTYSALSFWLTAALFASEHGPYWDVGLLAGMAYNLWMIRTRCLGDCILAHAATNSCLAVYVVLADQWQYWL